MSRKRQPKKPSAPLGGVAFGKDGSARRVQDEALPPEKAALELEIVSRFLQELAEHSGVKIGDPVPPVDPSDFPDFTAEVDGRFVGIELVAAVRHSSLIVKSTRQRYATRINELLLDVQTELAGYTVEMVDGDQDPPFPSLATRRGAELVAELAEFVRREIADLGTLRPGATRSRVWMHGAADHPTVGAFIYHRNDPDKPAVKFGGGYRVGEDDAHGRIAAAIQGKLAHFYDYGKPLWLLVHNDTYLPMVWSPEAVDNARELISTDARNPFDQIWFVNLLPGTKQVHLEKIHPDPRET